MSWKWLKDYKAWVSEPETYKVYYLNGTRTYTESFANIDVAASQVSAAEMDIKQVVDTMLTAVGGPFGAALQALVNLGLAWIESAIENPDGSLTLCFAHHYAGSARHGVDVTATPLPGVDSKEWFNAVNGLQDAIRVVRRANAVAGQSEGDPHP